MKVLVTGGAGYIGSHVCKALHRAGHVPITFDNLSTGDAKRVKWGPLEGTLDAALKHGIEAIMHLAAYTDVEDSVSYPIRYYRNNFVNSIPVFMEASVRDIPIIFSSTCAARDPISPYGRSKLFAEQALADVGHAEGLPWMTLRYFNVAGDDPDGEIGEDRNSIRLIPEILRSIKENLPFELFGDDYDTKDGTCVREYVHVIDIAEAHITALDYLVKGGESCMLELSGDNEYSVKEVIAIAEQVTGKKVTVCVRDRRGGDLPYSVGDVTKAFEVLGWYPTYNLKNQIQHAWNWMNK